MRSRLLGVLSAYSSAAENPGREHPFPVGGAFARSLGYPESLLSTLPAESVEAFTGVLTVSIDAEISTGDAVLDLGCGAGLDSLVAGQRTGPGGIVLGVDFSRPMLGRARRAADLSGATNVFFIQAGAENLPFEDGSIDAALVNGILNLNPGRSKILGELNRVIRPGGRAHVAELILREPLPPHLREDEAGWFA